MDTKGAVLLGVATTEEFVELLARAAAEQAKEDAELYDDLRAGYL